MLCHPSNNFISGIIAVLAKRHQPPKQYRLALAGVRLARRQWRRSRSIETISRLVWQSSASDVTKP